MNVALFTSFSPEIGGGSVNLRTLIAGLRDVRVTWYFLGPSREASPQRVSLGPPLVGGPIGRDLIRTPVMWLGGQRTRIDALVDRILAGRHDCHWVVAMDEGIPVGLRLAQRAPAVPVHVTIQDDQEHGMYGRSRRYRYVARLTRKPVRQLLRAARSVDVTSEEMGHYYRAQLGLSSTVLHPIVAGPVPAVTPPRDPRRLTLGHIGAIYSAREFETMLHALKRAAAELGREPAGCFIGLLPRYRPLVEQLGIAVEMPDWLNESEAVQRLARCDFVYAMYPFDRRSEVFVRTSLPTKLTTYVQAGRPVLAHAPNESTLARTVVRFGIGVACGENTVEAVAQGIARAATVECAPARFEELRSAFYGTDNATRLEALLRGGKVA